MATVSAIDIKKLWYCETTAITADVTAASLKTLLAANTTQEVQNIHQDTWSLEEAEPSQDSYKNQLTGSIYRMGKKTMGDITISFTIGQYDYTLKAALMGGTGTSTSWKRQRGIVDVKKAFIVKTVDDVYIVFPYCNLSTREGNTDGALGLAVAATIMEPPTTTIAPEYWFDAAAVEAAE